MLAIDDLNAFIVAHSRKGNKCGECGFVFTADRGDGKTAAIFRNVARGISVYVLCNTCAVNYKKHGKAAIPNAWRDSCIAATMYVFSKQPPGWIH
jgi:hypothetical protein